MDGVPCSWSAAGTPESFSRSKPDRADTLSKLAKLVARAEPHRQHPLNLSEPHRPQPPPVPSCVCPECDEEFPDMRELLHHQAIKHALPKPHQCLSCGKEFSLLSSLQLHKCPHESFACKVCLGQPQLGVPCPACMAGTSETDIHQDKSPHSQPHLHDSSPYACAPCGKGFSQKQTLLYHQQAGCSEPSSPVLDVSCPPADSPPSSSEPGSPPSDISDAPGPSTVGVYPCQSCSRTFCKERGLLLHQRHLHPEEYLAALAARATKKTLAAALAALTKKTKKVPVYIKKNVKRLGRPPGRLLGRPPGRPVDKPPDTPVGSLPDRPVVSPPGRQIGRQRGKSPKSKSKKKKLLSCRSCDMVFKNTAKLYLHRNEQHSREKSVWKDPKPVINKRRKGETYPCQVCGRVFLHHLSFMTHSKKHGGAPAVSITPGQNATKDSKLPEKKPKKLQNGPRSSNTVEAGSGTPGMKGVRLKEPLNHSGRPRKVPEVEEEADGEFHFPCPSCAEEFSSQSELKDHVELHQSSVRRKQCSVCTQEMAFSKGPGSRKQRLYHCLPCQQAFTALDTFLEHCQDHLRLKVEEDSITEAYYGNKN